MNEEIVSGNSLAWGVERLCCTSGQCFECYEVRAGRGSVPVAERKRVLQTYGVTHEAAKRTADGWRAYASKVVQARGPR